MDEPLEIVAREVVDDDLPSIARPVANTDLRAQVATHPFFEVSGPGGLRNERLDWLDDSDRLRNLPGDELLDPSNRQLFPHDALQDREGSGVIIEPEQCAGVSH